MESNLVSSFVPIQPNFITFLPLDGGGMEIIMSFKKILTLSALVITLFTVTFISACTDQNVPEDTQAPETEKRPAELTGAMAERIIDQCVFDSELTMVEGGDVPYLFYTGNMVEYGSVYLSHGADMFAVMLCRSEEYTEPVSEKLKAYISTLAGNTDPQSEYGKKLNEYVLQSKGKYVIMIVSADREKAVSTVNSLLDQQ